jgi:hypothetical protein
MNRPTLRRAPPLVILVLAVASGCGSEEQFDAKAPDVPFIDQYDPAGRDAYYDGSENCGPAVLAGIAKGRGLTHGLQDAEVIVLLAEVAGTDENGTSGNGMIAALEWMGLQTDAHPGGDLDWIDDELAAGHDVIANGDFYALPGNERPGLHSGHYIAVTGVRDGWSVYEVTDPAGRTDTALADWQLQTFIELHPQGGFTISAW